MFCHITKSWLVLYLDPYLYHKIASTQFQLHCGKLWLTINRIKSVLISSIPTGNSVQAGPSHLRSFSSWILPRSAVGSPISKCGPISSQAEGSGVFQQPQWHYQQVRTRKRGTEYQPKNIKRKRTHGWIKRLSTQGGIEVLLRRMLKGRKSLSHWCSQSDPARLSWNLECRESEFCCNGWYWDWHGCGIPALIISGTLKGVKELHLPLATSIAL